MVGVKAGPPGRTLIFGSGAQGSRPGQRGRVRQDLMGVRHVFRVVAIAAVALGSGPAQARVDALDTIGAPTMNEASTSAAQRLRLPDDVFHAKADDAFDGLNDTIAPVFGTGQPETPPPIFALGLPRVLDPERGVDIPGAVARRYQGSRRWEVDFTQNFRVVVVDLRTGAVRTVCPLMLDDPEVQPSRSGPEPSELNRRATLHGFERFTIPPVFDEDWAAAEYAVTAIQYDWITNTVVIARRPPPSIVAEPFRVPSRFLDPAPPSRSPGLTVDMPASVSPGGAIRITGGVAMPKTSVSLAHSTEEPDSVVMVATLLLVALDATHPVTVDFVVPVAVSGDTVSAAFSLDLAQRPEGADLAGDYQVYLVSGRTVAGPRKLTIGHR